MFMTDKDGCSGEICVNGTPSMDSRGKRDRAVLGEICVVSSLLFCSLLKVCFMCISVCLHVCLCTTCRPLPMETSSALLIPWNWSTGGCEQPCRDWELNPDPLSKQRMLLTTEPPAALAPVFLSQVPPVPSGQKEEARLRMWYCLPCQTLHLGPELPSNRPNRGLSGLCSHTPSGSEPAILRWGAVLWPLRVQTSEPWESWWLTPLQTPN